jgi:hypothetical protein
MIEINVYHKMPELTDYEGLVFKPFKIFNNKSNGTEKVDYKIDLPLFNILKPYFIEEFDKIDNKFEKKILTKELARRTLKWGSDVVGPLKTIVEMFEDATIHIDMNEIQSQFLLKKYLEKTLLEIRDDVKFNYHGFPPKYFENNFKRHNTSNKEFTSPKVSMNLEASAKMLSDKYSGLK